VFIQKTKNENLGNGLCVDSISEIKFNVLKQLLLNQNSIQYAKVQVVGDTFVY